MSASDASSELGLAEATLRQVDSLTCAVADIGEQLKGLDDVRQSLRRIEKSLAAAGAATTSSDSKRFRRQSNTSGDSALNVGTPAQQASLSTGNLGWSRGNTPAASVTPTMHGALDALSEHTVYNLQKRFRRQESQDDDLAPGSSRNCRGAPGAQEPSASKIGQSQPLDQKPLSDNELELDKIDVSQPLPRSHPASSFSSCSSRRVRTPGSPGRSHPVSSISSSSARPPARPMSMEPMPPTNALPSVVPQPTQLTSDADGRSTMMMRRNSLDRLRADHDAAITNAPTVHNHTTSNVVQAIQKDLDVHETALPPLGWFLLCVTGILDFGPGMRWTVLARLTAMMQVVIIVSAASALASWRGKVHQIEPLIVTLAYLIGAVAATLSLRRSGITTILGPAECPLDDYAAACGFLDDWKKTSRARLLQTGVFFILTLASRAAALLWSSDPCFGRVQEHDLLDVTTIVAFSTFAVGFCSACYCMLHVTAGLELAIDSFAVRCYAGGDMTDSVMEWNVVQATLRQTSSKLSGLVVVLASSGIAAMINMAYQVIHLTLSDSRWGMLDIVLWVGWLYPPILMFLYTLSSAAAVTE